MLGRASPLLQFGFRFRTRPTASSVASSNSAISSAEGGERDRDPRLEAFLGMARIWNAQGMAARGEGQAAGVDAEEEETQVQCLQVPRGQDSSPWPTNRRTD